MHNCPDCGVACYCGGDIDDCLIYSWFPACTHCGPEASDDDELLSDTEELEEEKPE